MFSEDFNKLQASEQLTFASVTNKLLLKGFIVRDIYDNREKIFRINPDYRFMERFFEIFESYLKFSGWHIEKDNILGVISLSNDYTENRIKFDRETSLILFSLRLIYDTRREESETDFDVYMTTPNLIIEMTERNITIPNKKLTGRGVARCLRILANHNIISKISGTYDNGDVTFYILPSIVYALDNDKIVAMSNALNELNKELEGDTQDDFIN